MVVEYVRVISLAMKALPKFRDPINKAVQRIYAAPPI